MYIYIYIYICYQIVARVEGVDLELAHGRLDLRVAQELPGVAQVVVRHAWIRRTKYDVWPADMQHRMTDDAR